MHIRLAPRCAFAAAFLSAALPVAAQTRVDLRPRLEPGSEHRFEMRIDTELHLRAPQAPAGTGAPPAGGHAGGPAEQKQSARQRVDFIVRVRETADTGATLELEYAGLEYSLESPNHTGSFNSAAPAADGDGSARALRPVIGTRLVVKVDAEGNVTEVAGGDHLASDPADGAAAPAEGPAAAFWTRVAAQFRERAIVASFVEPILGTHHPTGLAAVDETWTYSDTLEESMLGTFTILTEYRLESVEDGSAALKLSGTITADPPAGDAEPPFALLKSGNSGSAVWSTTDQILDSLEQTQSVTLRASMQGVKMDLDNSTTVKLTRKK